MSIQATYLFFTCLFTFLANIPFGYLRGGTKRFSLMWFLYIHMPVPLVILIRQYFSVELSWLVIPFLFSSFFVGQLMGKKLRPLSIPKHEENDC